MPHEVPRRRVLGEASHVSKLRLRGEYGDHPVGVVSKMRSCALARGLLYIFLTLLIGDWQKKDIEVDPPSRVRTRTPISSILFYLLILGASVDGL